MATGKKPNTAAVCEELARPVLEEMGLTIASVVKTTVFLADLNDFAKVNAIYPRFFEGAYPARSCVQVAALPKGGLVEIEAVVAK